MINGTTNTIILKYWQSYAVTSGDVNEAQRNESAG